MHLTECSYHVTYAFQSESALYDCLDVKELLAQNRRDTWILNNGNGTSFKSHLARKQTLNHLAKLANNSAVLWVLICTMHLTVCSYHAMYAFQSEFTLYNCLNVKELLAWNRRDIWNLSDCNGTRTYNHLVCKWILNHLARLAKWLSCVVNTYLYDAFDCMFLSCHIHISEWIHTPWWPEC